MGIEQHGFSRNQRVGIGSVALILGILVAALVMAPATALGQTPGAGTPGATASTTTTPALAMSPTSGLPGASVTANGTGFQPNETVDVTFNGQSVGQPTVNSGGS